jgi:hypothetical protein
VYIVSLLLAYWTLKGRVQVAEQTVVAWRTRQHVLGTCRKSMIWVPRHFTNPSPLFALAFQAFHAAGHTVDIPAKYHARCLYWWPARYLPTSSQSRPSGESRRLLFFFFFFSLLPPTTAQNLPFSYSFHTNTPTPTTLVTRRRTRTHILDSLPIIFFFFFFSFFLALIFLYF